MPISSEIHTKAYGSLNWEFDLVGLIDAEDPAVLGNTDVVLINVAHFDEARQFGKGKTGWYVVRVVDSEQARAVSSAIDTLFMNSPDETKTAPEKEFAIGFAKQIGDVGALVTRILIAVFFTILLLTGNTMAQSIRERIPELAILKTLGFSDRAVTALVLGEAALLLVLGGGLGMAAALGLMPVLNGATGGRFPPLFVDRTSRVIMLRAGSDAELSSGVLREQATLLAGLPGVARDGEGRPLASAELVVMVDLPRKGQADPNNVPFRGVQPAAFTIRDEVSVVEGHRFQRCVREVMVGRKASRQFAGLDVGSRIAFRDSDWTVVGIFVTGGDVHESEIWADAEVAMSAFRRTGFQSVTATLADGSAAGVAGLKEAVSRDPRLSISVLSEPEYYARQATILSRLIGVLGYSVAAFMAVGATFGALNCMYSAIASRQVEIATLRAIGFSGAPVVASVMIEALLLALVGGAVGGGLAYLYCDGASLSTLNFNTFSQVAFDFRVTRGLLARGLLWALLIGAAGGLLPAIRAARQPVTVALRAL